MRPPVIFIGMHRSGTSMLGRLMEKSGLFMGARKDPNNEALFFQRINEWLMAQSGARWDQPLGVRYLLENDRLLTHVEGQVRKLLDGPASISYLGWRRYFLMNGMSRLQTPWGWKDPRNTFTLPFWQRIFPQLKIVYIERHGVDVAQSLRVRGMNSLSSFYRCAERAGKFWPFTGKMGVLVDSPRCLDLGGGFALWQEYLSQADDLMSGVPGHRQLRLRYEEILENPEEMLEKVAVFCGLDGARDKIKPLVEDIDSSKAYVYRNSVELVKFAKENRRVLEEYGYA